MLGDVGIALFSELQPNLFDAAARTVSRQLYCSFDGTFFSQLALLHNRTAAADTGASGGYRDNDDS